MFSYHNASITPAIKKIELQNDVAISLAKMTMHALTDEDEVEYT